MFSVTHKPQVKHWKWTFLDFFRLNSRHFFLLRSRNLSFVLLATSKLKKNGKPCFKHFDNLAHWFECDPGMGHGVRCN